MVDIFPQLQKIPYGGVLLRTFALFQAYNALTKDEVEPITFATISIIFATIVHVSLGYVKLDHFKSLPYKQQFTLAAHGAWNAINTVVLLTCLIKLHPLRFVVGEYLEYCFAYVFLARRRSSGSEGGDPFTPQIPLKRACLMFILAIVLLGWASNLYTYTTPSGAEDSQEELLVFMDSIGGMLLLCGYVVSEVFRKRVRTRLVMELDEEVALDSFSLVFGAVALVPLWTLSTLFSSAAVIGSAGTWLSVLLNATLLMLVPSVIATRQRRITLPKRPTTKSQHRVLVALAGAAVLHACYHVHYSPTSGPHQNHVHPVLHWDNFIVLVVGGLIATGLHLLQDSSRDGAGGAGGGGIDDTMLLFAPVTQQETTLIASILENPKERKLATFFCLTLFFMFVELLYGLQVNSLGLVSDSFHMLLDSASIAIGLYAAHMAKWKPNASHPYGFGRYEIMAGFTNGVLLVFIAGYIFAEAIGRLYDPPHIEQNYLLGVSIIGLLVNIAGLLLFSDHSHHGHSHGGGGSCGGGDSHGHSHGGGHSHTLTDDGDDVNLRAVYLHILADFLGSVSVIVSSIIVNLTGWMIADPIGSAFISFLIFLASLPLLKETGRSLLQSVPAGIKVDALRGAIERIDHVKKVADLHIWTQATTPELICVCCVNLSVDGSCPDTTTVRSQVLHVLKNHGVKPEENISLQVDYQ